MDVLSYRSGAKETIKFLAATLLGVGGSKVVVRDRNTNQDSQNDNRQDNTGGGQDVTNNGGKTLQTYTKTNPKTGQTYCGRTSGCGTPEQNIARRDANHHMNQDGYGPAVLDKSSSNSAAIRGR